MSELEEIFIIGHQGERQKKLVEYAKSLKVNVAKARRSDGSLNEDEIAVLIYDAEKAIETARNKNIGFAAVGIFLTLVFVIILAGLFYMFK